jgi:NAD-dependent SIR2 family protein deacetylase
LESKGLVGKIFTENIDGLELKAGCTADNIEYYNGTVNEAKCCKCHSSFDISKLKEYIKKEEVLYCVDTNCKGAIMPNVNLDGETISEKYLEFQKTIKEYDACFILGTSMNVEPFNLIPYILNRNCYKIVINKESVGNFDYNNVSNNELFLEGSTDNVIAQLLKDMNLNNEFDHHIKKVTLN